MKKYNNKDLKVIIKEEYQKIQNEIGDNSFNIQSILGDNGKVDKDLGRKLSEAVYNVIKDVQKFDIKESAGRNKSQKTFNVITESQQCSHDLKEVLEGCKVEYLDVGNGRHTLFLERTSKRAKTILGYLQAEGINFSEVDENWK